MNKMLSAAQAAKMEIAQLTSEEKNEALLAMAQALLDNADDILAAGGQVELGVERHDAEHFGNGDIEFGSNGFENFLRKVAVNILSMLQNGDEGPFGILLIRGQDIHQRSKVDSLIRAVARHVGILLILT